VEEARRLAGRSGRVATVDLPLVLEPEHAARTVETWLFETWAARERAQFSLPPSRRALEPGDVVSLITGGRSRLLRITDIGEHGVRDIEGRGIDPEVYAATAPAVRRTAGGTSVVIGQPLVMFLDLPLLRGDEPAHAGMVAAAQNPWPGGIAFYRSPETSGFVLKALARTNAVTGVTIDPVWPGATSRFERGNTRVRLDQGSLASVTGRGLVPLSPVHLRGTRSAGDLSMTGSAAPRIGGDSWDSVEVPLGEDAERYEIDILDGGDAVRTLSAASPTATYTAAPQTDDFGSPQSSVSLRIYQLSTTAGRGTPRPAVL
jgi:Putative phage tail protein